MSTALGKTPVRRGPVIAWGFWDWGGAAYNAVILTFVFSVYLTDSVGEDLPGSIDASAWLGYAIGAAGLVIALAAPVIGQNADASGHRKRSTTIWTVLTVATMAGLFVVRDDYTYLWIGLLLLGLGSIFFELASVSYNAMLCQVSTPENMGRISGFGWSMGYFGGIVLLLAVYTGLIAGDGDTRGFLGVPTDGGLNIRVVALVSAAWFLLFALPLFLRVPEVAPDPDRPARLGVVGSYRKLFTDLGALYRRSPQTVFFLLASALFRDGLAAIFTFGAVLAVTVYGIGAGDVLIFGIAANVVSAAGALTGGWLEDRVGPKPVIVASLIGLIVDGVVLLFLSGPTSFWIFGLILTLFVGPAQSSSRTFLARLAPDGREGQLFGLYATTGRAVSFIAPTLFGVFTSIFGAPRAGIVGILLVLVAGLVALLPVRALYDYADHDHGSCSGRASDWGALVMSSAREQRGWVFYDWANQVFQTSVITVFLSLYLTSVAEADAQASGQPCTDPNALVQCDVSLFGIPVAAGSVFGYLISLSTVLQVLVLPVVGAIADRSRDKRRMLAGFAFVGSGATAALAVMAGTNWQAGFVLFLVANTAYGASIVVYYAFLPELAGPDERDALSARGWAFGYLGGGLALVVHLAIYLGHDALGLSSGDAVRICFVTAGVWWAAFTLIPLRRLGNHPAAPTGRSTNGFRQLAATLREARRFPLTLAFLGAYLIFADGISTVAQIAGLYGERELLLPREILIATILLVQFVAYGGAVLHGRLAARYGARRTILGSLVAWTVITAVAYFVEVGSTWQFIAVAVAIGLVLGGTLALTRSLYSQLIPPGREAEYFALYEIGERGTSWIGPLVFSAVAGATGSFRPAIISLVVFFVVGGVAMAFVPLRRAIRAAGNEEPALV